MSSVVVFWWAIVLCCSMTLFAQQDFDGSKYDVPSDSDNALFMPFTGESTNFIKTNVGKRRCYVKVYNYDGVPYSGGACLNENGLIDSVSYWNVEQLKSLKEDIKNGAVLDLSMSVWVEDSTISVKSRVPIDMYVINALTGDTVLSNHFPKPKMRTDVIRMKKGISERHKEIMQKRGGYAFSGDSVSVEMIDEILHYDYSLPQGLYFAYFVDVEDRVLCWAEKINKK